MNIIELKRAISDYETLLAEVSRIMRLSIKAGDFSAWRKWKDKHDGLRFARDYFSDELRSVYGLEY
jgi:hypothetical protein